VLAGCLLVSLADIFGDSEGQACKDLLRLPGAIPLLAQGLEGPATRGAGEQLHPMLAYLLHVTALDQLCRWTASVIGLRGLQQIAQHLARPMIAGLDHLFCLSDQGRVARAQQ
jgi:hypothetical protein